MSTQFGSLKDRRYRLIDPSVAPEDSDEERNDAHEALNNEKAERMPIPEPESYRREESEKDQTEKNGNGDVRTLSNAGPVGYHGPSRDEEREERRSYRPNGTFILRKNGHGDGGRHGDAHQIEEIEGIECSP